MKRVWILVAATWMAGGSAALSARGDTVTFFDPAQVAVIVNQGVNTDTLRCDGFQFQYTRDKLFTGGVGLTEPIGRYERVSWPDGLEAQAITTGPNIGKASIVITRVDGGVFDIPAFTFKLLANAGAGRDVEIMPSIGGEDAFNDPFYFNANGNAGNSFSYDTTTPAYLGNTTPLVGYDRYTIGLTLDYALTALTLEGAGLPEPSLLGFGGLAVLAMKRPSRRGR